MINLYEMILKEDVNSFIEWTNDEMEKTSKSENIKLNIKKKIENYRHNKEKYKPILEKIYNITININEINTKSLIKIFLNDEKNNTLIYYAQLIEYYIKVLNMNPKQYGVNLRKINKHNETMDLRDEIIVSLNKIKQAKAKSSIKKNSRKSRDKNERMADEFLYEDDDVIISLFTRYETANVNFYGLSDWCVTKDKKHWSYYNKNAFLVLFRNKSIRFTNKKETPNAYFCNNYGIINSNSIDDGVTYNLNDTEMPHPNFTTKYHDIVEKECLDIFEGDFTNFENFIEISNDEDSIFYDAFQYLVDDKVVADKLVYIQDPEGNYFDENDRHSEHLCTEKDMEKMENAEFHEGIEFISVKFNSPDIGFVGEKFVITDSSLTVDIKDNDIKKLTMEKPGDISLEFHTELNLSSLSIEDFYDSNYNVAIIANKSLNIQEFGFGGGYLFGDISSDSYTSLRLYRGKIIIEGKKGGEVSVFMEDYMMPTYIEDFDKLSLTFSGDPSEHQLDIYGVKEITIYCYDEDQKKYIEGAIEDGSIHLSGDPIINWEID